MLFDFYNHLNNNYLNDYLNCYSTFLLSKKELKKNILNIRMNVLIDTYLYINKKNKFDLKYYYLNNFKDVYMNKPLITYDFKDNKINNDENDDDIDDHYKLMFIKNPEKEVINYDEIDNKYREEELKKEEEEYYNSYDLYEEDDYDDEEEYYEDFNNNVYEEEEYYDEYY